MLRRYLELSDGMLGPLERGTEGAADLHALLDRIGVGNPGPDTTVGCLVVATLQDPINKDPQVAALTGQHLAKMRSAIKAAVLRAHTAGEPLPTTPKDFTHVVYAAILGILVSARSGDALTTHLMIDGVRALLLERGQCLRLGRPVPLNRSRRRSPGSGSGQ